MCYFLFSCFDLKNYYSSYFVSSHYDANYLVGYFDAM